MDKKQYNFGLDVIRKRTIPVIEFTQNDTSANELIITITNDYEVYDLTGCTVAVIFYKPDTNLVIGQATITNATLGIVNYLLGTQEISVAGDVESVVEIYGLNGERLTTSKFTMTVIADYDTENAIQSETVFPILTSLIAEINTFKPQNTPEVGQVIMKTGEGVIWKHITLDNGEV